MEISQAELEAIIKKAVGDALATFASGGSTPLMALHDTSGDDTSGPWQPGSPATNIGELERNACYFNGRDAEGYRHRSRSPGEILQFEGSLDDAEAELKAARIWTGDYLDFGPEQLGKRFSSWKSLAELGAARGLVCRYALLVNLIPTAAERKLSPMAAPTFDVAEAQFAGMTNADLWAWLLKQRGLTGGASGAEVTTQATGGGGPKG